MHDVVERKGDHDQLLDGVHIQNIQIAITYRNKGVCHILYKFHTC